jgi:hypothetical protein
LPDLVTDLLRLNVSLIVASAPVTSRAAKDATAIEWEAFTAKQLQIIKEALPKSLVTVRSLSK